MMTTQPVIQERYKSDHLFLLVGTNPLPNFVAATLMLRSQGQLYLVHSDKTKAVAERLARYWAENYRQPQFVCVNESDGADIRQHIDYALKPIVDAHVGLNYTGGTKMMAVHASQTIRDYQTSRRRPVTLSYLDARTNRMYIEHGKDKPFLTESLLYEVKPFIQNIVNLHAFKLVSEIETQAILPDLAAMLATLHQNDSAGQEWRAWCDTVLRRQTRNEKGRWYKEADLLRARIQAPTGDLLKPFVDDLTQREIIQNGEISIQQACSSLGLTKGKYLCEWLDGKWLEHYVFHTLQQIKISNPETHIHDIGMGIRPQSEPGSPEYDIDIGVMQGYRLYAISCTTDADPGMCKLKLFEAYLRARNMAGDEAFVGLICMTDKPENLERQVGRAWDAEGKVRVFGRPHLSNLADALVNWFISAGA